MIKEIYDKDLGVVFINPNYIISIVEDGIEGYARINMCDNHFYQVTGWPRDIVEKLKGE